MVPTLLRAVTRLAAILLLAEREAAEVEALDPRSDKRRKNFPACQSVKLSDAPFTGKGQLKNSNAQITS
jgi:hypothetical protein